MDEVILPKLTNAQRHNAMEADLSRHDVARQFGMSLWLWVRYNDTQTVTDRRKNEQPRVTNPVQDRYIRSRHLRDRTSIATSTNQGWAESLSRQFTTTLILKEEGLFARRSVRRNVLIQRHVVKRLHWCQQRLIWRNRDLFTDWRACLYL